MAPVILHSPIELPWQTAVFDLLMLAIFIAAVVHACWQFRRGIRIFAFVLVAALVYGVVLELAGMATLNMYVQGDFPVMLNFPAIPLFAGTTAMPLYVTLFYPVIFTIGFKVVEGCGIAKDWQAAVTGGLFMIFLDAPYIIEGNLRHVVWWTWDPDFTMFQYWLGWPLVDMFWQSTWGATFYYLMLRARPHLEGADSRWSTRWALGVCAPVAAVAVLTLGTVWFLPLVLATLTVGQQWPVLVVLVAGMSAVAVTALRSARPAPRADPFTLCLVGSYVSAFAAMVIGNMIHDGGIRWYAVVQAIGLMGMVVFATAPYGLSRNGPTTPPGGGVGQAGGQVPTARSPVGHTE